MAGATPRGAADRTACTTGHCDKRNMRFGISFTGGDKVRNIKKTVAAALAATLLLGACANDTSETTEGGRGSTAAPVPEDPIYGGRIVVGLEAETGGGFTPASAVWDLTGYIRANAVLEPLFLLSENGTYDPWLATGATPSADHKTWTITLREGVKFHNGEDLTAELVATNLDQSLRGLMASNMVSVESAVAVDDLTVQVNLLEPNVALPAVLSTAAGYIVAQEQLDKVAGGDPQAGNLPIGTGPFQTVEYVPGSVNFLASRFDGYWKTDEEGRKLPYLDEVEFQTIPDGTARDIAFRNGQLDVNVTETTEFITFAEQNADKYHVQLNPEYAEGVYVLINVSEAPLDDLRIRQALKLATAPLDPEPDGRITRASNGPFSPGTIGYLEDSGWTRTYDVTAARKLVDEYKAEKGVSSVDVELMTPARQDLLADLQRQQQFWRDAGINVTIRQVEQSQYIATAALGDFDVFQWRNHWGADPALQSMWWKSGPADAPISLNFGRINDAVIDANLKVIRENPDPAARKAAAEEINRQFAKQVYNIWSTWTTWAYLSHADVIDTNTLSFPDGTAVETGVGGHGWFTETWLNRPELAEQPAE